jgi:hypothetical protein
VDTPVETTALDAPTEAGALEPRAQADQTSQTLVTEQAKNGNKGQDVELSHVLEPDFAKNKDGSFRLSGLHHIEGSQNLDVGRVADLLSGPNEHGVYEAVVEAKNPADGATYQKFSTMFPDELTKDEVSAPSVAMTVRQTAG